ncbi:MAG: hypothetical protein ABI843_08575 [Dokdonella sp.]
MKATIDCRSASVKGARPAGLDVIRIGTGACAILAVALAVAGKTRLDPTASASARQAGNNLMRGCNADAVWVRFIVISLGLNNRVLPAARAFASANRVSRSPTL